MALKNQDGATWRIDEEGRIIKTGEKKYPNGNLYKGDFVDGWKDGKGDMKFFNGERYVGSFKADMIHGYGTYTWPEYMDTTRNEILKGKRYEGMFFTGRKHGHGDFYLGNGEHYIGMFKKDLYFGKGMLTKKNGDSIEGEFYAGKISGKAICRYGNGDEYHGQTSKGKFDGYGEYKWKGKKGYMQGTYHGEYKNGLQHGKGSRTYSNGNHYEGYFKFGKACGDGLMQYSNGDTYIGQWQEGFPDGKGIYTFNSGAVYNGEIIAGCFQGKGVMKYEDGSTYDGDWGTVKGVKAHDMFYPAKDAKRHGYGIRQWCNGDRYEGQWDRDKMHGKGKIIKKDGGSFIGNFKNNFKTGHGIELYGNLVGAQFACPNGYIHDGSGFCKYEGNYLNDWFDGYGRFTCTDGKVFEGNWINNERNGYGIQIISGEMDRGDPQRYYMGGKGGLYRAVRYVGGWKDNMRSGLGCLAYPNGDFLVGNFQKGQMFGRGLIMFHKTSRCRVGLYERGTRIKWLDDDIPDPMGKDKDKYDLMEKSRADFVLELENLTAKPLRDPATKLDVIKVFKRIAKDTSMSVKALKNVGLLKLGQKKAPKKKILPVVNEDGEESIVTEKQITQPINNQLEDRLENEKLEKKEKLEKHQLKT